MIAQTACFLNVLPQGAPSSPIISELISQTLDYRLQALARKFRCSYSRYADDITFSTNLKEFPSAIAFCPPGEVNWREGPDLEKAVLSSNLKLNSKKARMQQSYQRQATTGLPLTLPIALMNPETGSGTAMDQFIAALDQGTDRAFVDAVVDASAAGEAAVTEAAAHAVGQPFRKRSEGETS